jgi:transposase
MKQYIKEYAWSKIFSFLKGRKDIYIKSESDCRVFLEAVLWMSEAGSSWRKLDSGYPKWNSIYKRFNSWMKKNIWVELLEYCIEDPDLEYVMIDSTIIRAHPCAAGYKKNSQNVEGLGRSKGGFTTKVHAKVDALGNVLKIIITPGQRNDCTQAKNLMEGHIGEYTIADKGYDSDEIRETIKANGSEAVIPPRTNRKTQYDYDKEIYKERHAVEVFFSKMKHFRRIFTRYDKSAIAFGSFLSFAGAILWLR